MKLRLTDLAVKKLAHPKHGQVDVFDLQTANFGIRCSTRNKSFFVLLGDSGRRKRKTIGRYPSLSLADARKVAKQLLATTVVEPTVVSPEFNVVRDAYLADCRNRLRANTLDGYSMYLNQIRFTGPIAGITQGQIIRAIEAYTTSPSSQNYAFTTFKVFFNWAVKRQYLAANPLAVLTRPNRQKARDRVLTEEEMKILLEFTTLNRSRFSDIVTLLILTGQRRSEIAGLQWTEVEEDRLILPSERTKNKRKHVVPIGTRAQEILHSVEGSATYVFGSSFNDTPFNGWSKAQRKLLKHTGLPHFTLHDLRRTFATIHAKIGTPIHVTEQLLNHASGTISGVAAIYNRHNYLEEMITASVSYEATIHELMSA